MPGTREEDWTPVSLIRWTAEYLAGKGHDQSRLAAELMLAATLGVKRLDLYLQFERPLVAAELAAFKQRLQRRLNHEPLQYIEGRVHFRDIELQVDRRVLVPRPETELLAGAVLDWAAGRTGLGALDVGTGSGAIALSLACEADFARIVATDVSPGAIAVAEANRQAIAPAAPVELRLGRGYEPVAGETFQVIVSNPPYIADGERAELAPQVRDWEPEEALFAGPSGLEVIRQLVTGAPAHLDAGGLLALEIGATQAAAASALIAATGGFEAVRVERDYAGRDRMVLATRSGG